MSQIEKRNKVFWGALLLILIGANMRSVLTASTPVLGEIAKSFALPNWFLGSITTIPLLCFSLVSPFVNKLRQKFGMMPLLGFTFVILLIGSYIRIYSFGFLLIGMLLIGISIAILNVLAPAVVASLFPHNLGKMTSFYTLSMTIFSAITAGFSSPLASVIGWQSMFQWLSVFPIVGLIIDIFNCRQKTSSADGSAKIITQHTKTHTERKSVWKNRYAWYLTGFMGLQSLLFYTILTWIPSIWSEAGFTHNEASLLLGFLQISSLPMAYIIPVLAGKRKNQSSLIWLILVLFTIGLVLLLLHSNSLILAIADCIILGFGSNAAFSMAMVLFSLKTSNPEETTIVSGMAQSIGYLVAAAGPILAGIMHNILSSWNPVLITAIIIVFIQTYCGLSVNKNEKIF